jgi:multisubunit Na+/H+ antiporter MnhB subunit
MDTMTGSPVKTQERPIVLRVLLLLAAVALGLALGWAVWSLPPPTGGLAAAVQAELVHSGVHSPITAVLLNFRGYDTLLEIGVLLVALLGAWSLHAARMRHGSPVPHAPGPVLAALVSRLVPAMVLVAAYVTWLGSHAPGGAFQGGAVLGAAGVLLLLLDIPLAARLPGWLLRLLPALGFTVFLGVAVGVMATGGHLLAYPAGWAKSLIVLIEGTLTLSIGIILMALFASEPPARVVEAAQEPLQHTGDGQP